MNTELKQLTAALAAAGNASSEIGRKLAEAGQHRDDLAAQLVSIDAAVEGAEIAHAAALAAEHLGEQADTKSTGEALAAARAALSGKMDLTQQHRVAVALCEGLRGRHEQAHGKYVLLNERHRAAQGDVLEGLARAAMDEAEELVAALIQSAAKISAIRSLMDVEFGRPWKLGTIDATPMSRAPSQTAIEAHKQSIRAALSAA